MVYDQDAGQRLRVFVWSTLDELAAERGAARAAIEGLRLTPVMFESGARAHPPQVVCRAYLEQSDIFRRDLLVAVRLGGAGHDHFRPRG